MYLMVFQYVQTVQNIEVGITNNSVFFLRILYNSGKSFYQNNPAIYSKPWNISTIDGRTMSYSNLSYLKKMLT